MTKNKFAGLAEAKMRSLETEEKGKEPQGETVSKKPEKKKAVKLANKLTTRLLR